MQRAPARVYGDTHVLEQSPRSLYVPAAGAIRQDGLEEVRKGSRHARVEEVVVVERRLMLKEEIRVRKTRRIEHHREQVRLRTQDAEILRCRPERPRPRSNRRDRSAGRRADANRDSAPGGGASTKGAIP